MIRTNSFYVSKCWQKGLTSGIESLSNSLVLPFLSLQLPDLSGVLTLVGA